MKGLFRWFFIAMIVSGVANAGMFQSVPADKAQLLQSGKGKLYCSNCGMNLVMFNKTSHAMKQHDGDTHQYCSMHCLVEANKKVSSDTQVVDVTSLKFIRAADATYVVGSAKKGTMTMTSKYAFAHKADAETFARKNGGEVMDFEHALQIASAGLDKENKMINGKRDKMAKKGKRMFTKLCSQDKLPVFASVAEAKTYVVSSGICGTLKEKQYQAIALYLTRKDTMTQQVSQKIDLPEDAKCPVCGMFVSKYPKWAAMITLKHGHKHYFDGVKDMMKFYLNPLKFYPDVMHDFDKAYVTDYYTLETIEAKQAWFVLGSNVYGPMGNEFIPFKTKKEAMLFKKNHFAKEVLPFNKITEEMLYNLDN